MAQAQPTDNPIPGGFPGIKVELWGDSHFADHHHFPAALGPYLTAPKYLPKLSNHSVGGRKFDGNFVSQFKGHLNESEKNRPSIQLLFIGGNNIRTKYRSHGGSQAASNEIRSMLEGYKALISSAAQFAKVKLAIVAPLPSQHKQHEEFFSEFSAGLQELCNQHPDNTIFIDIRDAFFANPEATPEGKIYNKSLFQDDIHLNVNGANILANKIFTDLDNNIPNSFFGYRKKPNRAERKAKNQS